MADGHFDAVFEEGDLQRLVDALYRDVKRVDKREVLTLADAFDVGPYAREIAQSLPAGSYTRTQLTTQLNSTITAHGWTLKLGLLE